MANKSTLQIKVCEARGVRIADSNGFSDPYCILTYGNAKIRTRIVKKTLDPKWNQTFQVPIQDDTLIHISCWDKDTVSQDDFLGQCAVDVRDVHTDGRDIWLKFEERGKDEGVTGHLLLQLKALKPGETGSTDDIEATGQHAPAAKANKKAGGSISKLKERLGELQAARSSDLDLSSCELLGIPKVVLDLNFLTHLNLGFNAIKDCPNLATLPLLEFLDFSGNKIGELNNSIVALTNLKELLLNGNKVRYIPTEIVALQALSKLDLSNNAITAIPAEIGRLRALEELYLTGNIIEQLPESISNLQKLEVLDCSACGLTSIPEDFSYQTRLIELNLATNKLQQLPTTFGRMTRLGSLDLSDNQLIDLPISIGYCGALVSLHIEGNPIKSQEMLKKYSIGSDHLVDFLEKRMIAYKVRTNTDFDSLLFPTQETKKKSIYEQQIKEEMTPEQKLGAVKMEARGMIQEILITLGETRKELLQTKNLSDTMRFAQLVRKLKPEIESIKESIPPQPQVPMAIIHQGEDKLIAFQKTVNGAIKEAEVILLGLQKELAVRQLPSEVIPLVKKIKPIRVVLNL